IGAGAPDHDRSLGDLAQVESVQRLAGLQHYVVGRVDHIVERAHAAKLQAAAQADWRGPDLDVRHGERGVTRPQVGVRIVAYELCRPVRWGAAANRRWPWRFELDVENRRHFAGETDDGKAVAPVGRNFHVQDGVGQDKKRGQVGSYWGVVG